MPSSTCYLLSICPSIILSSTYLLSTYPYYVILRLCVYMYVYVVEYNLFEIFPVVISPLSFGISITFCCYDQARGSPGRIQSEREERGWLPWKNSYQEVWSPFSVGRCSCKELQRRPREWTQGSMFSFSSQLIFFFFLILAEVGKEWWLLETQKKFKGKFEQEVWFSLLLARPRKSTCFFRNAQGSWPLQIQRSWGRIPREHVCGGASGFGCLELGFWGEDLPSFEGVSQECSRGPYSWGVQGETGQKEQLCTYVATAKALPILIKRAGTRSL